MINFLKIFKYYIFFFYFSAVYNLLCKLFDVTGSIGLRESIYLSFMWLIPILFFQKYSKKIAGIIGLILWGGSLFSLGYFFLYHQEFSQSVLFIIFESNMSESSEFLQAYFQWWIIPAVFIYSYIGYFFWKRLESFEVKLAPVVLLSLLFALVPFHKFLSMYYLDGKSYDESVYKQMARMQSSTPWNLIVGYVNYKHDLNQMEQLLEKNNQLKPMPNLTDKYKNENSTLVLVIGESTNRNRMSLYGYDRNTTPILDSMKNELDIFDNVYSPRPYTIEVLQQALTFGDEKHPSLYLTKPNLINIMKQAGYKTYWITNQQTQTKRNTMLTTFSQMCDEQIYLNNNQKQNSYSFDEVVLNPFETILNDKNAKKKLIVVHLLGTHNKYEYRYPQEFAKFDNQPIDDNRLDVGDKESYNDYDNAVYYNDFVVSKLINDIKTYQDNAALLYFSDHGEEVFDSKKVKKMGRNELDPTVAMYSIPFMIYRNDSFKKLGQAKKDYKNNLHRFYSSSNLIYTFLDLAGITYDGFESSKSIVNNSFKEEPVLIGDPYKTNALIDIQSLIEHKRG